MTQLITLTCMHEGLSRFQKLCRNLGVMAYFFTPRAGRQREEKDLWDLLNHKPYQFCNPQVHCDMSQN